MRTFYLRYRGQTLDEIDLKDIRESLRNIVKSGSIPHAFLFSGPKGTGKTSAARILAKIVNCERLTKNIEPCNKCDHCVSITKGNNIDVIELDAASHRGIDDVRALRDAVKLSPVSARKKVYIIDEAHMLTPEASNALLKTLEEPPEHVFFILATTNPEKLIETIRSRTVSFIFRKAKEDEIKRSLERIVKGEKIKIEMESLELIAKAAKGSFRDGAKILEQLALEGKSLDEDRVEEFLFNTKTFDVENFISLLALRKTSSALVEVESVVQKGGSMENLIATVLATLRETLLAKVGVGEGKAGGLQRFSQSDLLRLIELFSTANLQLRDALIDQLPVEVAVVKWCERRGDGRVQSTRLDLNSPAENVTSQKETSTLDSASPGLAQTINPGVREQTPAHEIKELSDEVWKKILASVRPINASIEALLRAARPLDYKDKVLTLGVFYKFHKEKLEEKGNLRILEDVVANILGNTVRIACTLSAPPVKKIDEKKSEGETVLTEGNDRDIIKVAEEIFGN